MTTTKFINHPSMDNTLFAAVATVEAFKAKLEELFGANLTFRIDPSYETCIEAYTGDFNQYVGAFYEDDNTAFIYTESLQGE